MLTALLLPAEAGTRFSDRRGMQGRVDLGNAVEVRDPYPQADRGPSARHV